MQKSKVLITVFIFFLFFFVFMSNNQAANLEYRAQGVHYTDGYTLMVVTGYFYNGTNQDIDKINEIDMTVTLFDQGQKGQVLKVHQAHFNDINIKIPANKSVKHKFTFKVDSWATFFGYQVKTVIK